MCQYTDRGLSISNVRFIHPCMSSKIFDLHTGGDGFYRLDVAQLIWTQCGEYAGCNRRKMKFDRRKSLSTFWSVEVMPLFGSAWHSTDELCISINLWISKCRMPYATHFPLHIFNLATCFAVACAVQCYHDIYAHRSHNGTDSSTETCVNCSVGTYTAFSGAHTSCFSFNKRLDALGKKLSCWSGLHRFEWAARYCDTGQSLCTCYGWLTSKKKYFVANVCTQHNILLRMYAHNTTKHNPCEFTTWQDVKTFRAITKGRCLRGANEKLDFLKHTSRLMHQHL